MDDDFTPTTPDESELETEPGRDEESAARERWRRRARNTAIVVILLILLLIIVDMLVVRGPAERTFVKRNIECLRCHTELLDQFEMAQVHDPFASKRCTSCHTPHGYKYRKTVKGGDFSAWEWLHRSLDRFYLDILWRVFAGNWVVEDSGPASSSSAGQTKGKDSELVAPIKELCWTCHGNLGPELGMEFQHRPFTDGRCTSCHNPHASNVKKLLVQKPEDLCVQCHQIGSDLAMNDVHPPFGKRQCLSCHKPHASDWKGVLVIEQRELCFGCHPKVAPLLSKKFQHQPFVDGDCTGCHKPHASEDVPLLITQRPQLCYLCHERIAWAFDKPSHHPLNRIGCQDCHLPHAADYDAVLVKPEPTLCFGCHTEIFEQRSLPIQHQPFMKDKCTICHVPHGAKNAPLLKKREWDLCYDCHPAIKADFQMKSHHPLGKKGLTCTGCHRPHASMFFPLLHTTGKKLCYRCHGSYKPLFEASLHGPLKCSECHVPHGSPYTPLLNQPNPEVCLKCHSDYANRPNFHPTRPKWHDYHSGKPLTCTSSCHNPHGTINYHMLRVGYGQRGFGTDAICRLCHSDVGILY